MLRSMYESQRKDPAPRLPTTGLARGYADMSRSQLAAIIDSSDDAIISTDTAGIVQTWNKAAETLYGYPAAGVIGRSLALIMPPSEVGRYGEWIQRVAAGERLRRLECNCVRADGVVMENSMTLSPVRDLFGQVLGISSISRDMTESKRVERERSRLIEAMEQAVDGKALVNLSGQIDFVNEAFTRLAETRREELLGAEFQSVHAKKQAAFDFSAVTLRLAAGETVAATYEFRLADGKAGVEQMLISPIYDDRKRINSYLVQVRDVSKETALQRRMDRAQKVELLGKLSGGIAHDFNNILTCAIGFTDMAILENSEPRVCEYLRGVQQANHRAGNLVKQILGFSQPREEQFGSLELAPMLTQVAKLLRASLPATISIDCADATGLPPVLGDATQIHHVLLNLCVNVGHAMTGGGNLTIAVSAAHVKEAARLDLGELEPGKIRCRLGE